MQDFIKKNILIFPLFIIVLTSTTFQSSPEPPSPDSTWWKNLEGEVGGHYWSLVNSKGEMFSNIMTMMMVMMMKMNSRIKNNKEDWGFLLIYFV